MQINRLPNKIGCGIITNHSVYLTEKGYTILELRLSMMEEADLKFEIPVLMKDNTIKMFESENSINIKIKKLHSNGKKVAILLDEYEHNKDRFPSIKDFLEQKNNLFELNEDDIVFFQSNNGFSI